MKTVKSGTAIIAEPKRTAQKGKPMDNLISRRAAIDAVETKIKKWNAVDGEGYHVGLGLRYTDVIDTLTELPSAQPEPCDFCKHQADCGDMALYCPAERKEGEEAV